MFIKILACFLNLISVFIDLSIKAEKIMPTNVYKREREKEQVNKECEGRMTRIKESGNKESNSYAGIKPEV